jgi:signal transduction histidine kinase
MMSPLAVTTQSPVRASDLQSIAEFRDLAPADLEWLAALMWEQVLEPGAALVKERDPADRMFVVLEGEMQARRESSPDAPTFLIERGQVTGMLPFSRMREFTVTCRATVRTRIACLSPSHFDIVLERIPELVPRLVGVMSDRIREMAREGVQREKLSALGRLTAGLAHELNNPAAAVVRGVQTVRDAVAEWQRATTSLESLGLSAAQRQTLADCERECMEALPELPPLDSIGQSDREEQIVRLLGEHGVPDPWRFSQILVESGFESEDLSCVSRIFSAEAIPHVLSRFASTLAIERVLNEIGMAARHISDLVESMKGYSLLDQAPVQNVDVHRGLEDTLAVVRHRTGPGIMVVRQYDPAVPLLPANGRELNQVWTNLIDNALDAVGHQGEIHIRTQRELERVLVEITDNGPGIPPEIQDRVFEPFFTTKPVGQATGLGLDIAFRAVRKHHGEIRFESKPGCTRFYVRLPFETLELTSTAGTQA